MTGQTSNKRNNKEKNRAPKSGPIPKKREVAGGAVHKKGERRLQGSIFT